MIYEDANGYLNWFNKSGFIASMHKNPQRMLKFAEIDCLENKSLERWEEMFDKIAKQKMKFGITNLSWKTELDGSIAKDLSQFDYFETVFPRRDSGNYYSTQSIFYGCDIQSFEQKEKTINHLRYVIEECSKYEIKIIVFGSPSLRKGSKIKLLEVFDEIDNELKNKNIILCVEPNSKYYNGEYYFSLDEIVPDIKRYSNIKTMIDSHNLILEGDDMFLTYEKYSDYIKHIHISEKDLKPVKDFDYYKKFISFLRDNSYNLGITYELKQCENIISEAHKFVGLKK